MIVRETVRATYVEDIVRRLLGELTEAQQIVNLDDLRLCLLRFLLLSGLLLQNLSRISVT